MGTQWIAMARQASRCPSEGGLRAQSAWPTRQLAAPGCRSRGTRGALNGASLDPSRPSPARKVAMYGIG